MFFNNPDTSNTKLLFFFVTYSIIALIVAYNLPPMHDYARYFKHWDLVLAGGDPWQKMVAANAYGPIHNLFAWLYALDKQIPKLVFVASWLFIAIYSVNRFWKLAKPTPTQKLFYLLFWFCNPFFILSTVVYGFNDNLVALFVFIGLLLIVQFKRNEWGVVVITLGILTKLYPVFLLPFVSFNKKLILKYALMFILLLGTGYLLTYWVWGGSFVNALGKANGRDPTLFSIMRFVDGAYFPFEMLSEIIIALTNLFILLGVGYVFKVFKDGKIDQTTAFLAGFAMLLIFYKAGQQQFYLTYFSLFAIWSFNEFQKNTPNLKAFYSILLLGGWFALMAGLVYPFTNEMHGEYEWIRDLIGLPTFLIQLIVVFFLLKPPGLVIEKHTIQS